MRGRTYHNEKKMPDKWQAQVTTVILQVSSSEHTAKCSQSVSVRACIVCMFHDEKKKVPDEQQARQAIPAILQRSSSVFFFFLGGGGACVHTHAYTCHNEKRMSD